MNKWWQRNKFQAEESAKDELTITKVAPAPAMS